MTKVDTLGGMLVAAKAGQAAGLLADLEHAAAGLGGADRDALIVEVSRAQRALDRLWVAVGMPYCWTCHDEVAEPGGYCGLCGRQGPDEEER
jgi:hypothetical protein